MPMAMLVAMPEEVLISHQAGRVAMPVAVVIRPLEVLEVLQAAAVTDSIDATCPRKSTASRSTMH